MNKLWSWIKAFFGKSSLVRPKGEVHLGITWGNYEVDYLDTLIGVSKRGIESGHDVPPDVVPLPMLGFEASAVQEVGAF
jgi:hypothetical protein